MPQDLYAYSLSWRETGWIWRVYDVEGFMVAEGSSLSEDRAWAAVQAFIPHAKPPLRDAV